jgi:hypothetical protein
LKDRKSTVSLVSVKLISVDPALFELPADYTPWRPPASSQTNNPPATTNK